MVKRSFLASVAGALPAALAGCNTVAGVGKNMERAGDAAQYAATRH